MNAPRMPLGSTLLEQARQALARRNLRLADMLYVRYIEQTTDDAMALAEYGEFCLRTDRNAEATYFLWKATRLGKSGPDQWAGLGHARLEIGDQVGAREAFANALALAPRHAIATYGYAQCLQFDGDWNGAVAALERVLATQPDNLAVLANIANAYSHAGNSDRAVVMFDRVEQMACGDPEMLLEAGKFHRNRGAHRKAMASLTQCARARPGAPDVWLEIARCHRAAGAIDIAVKALDEVARLRPNMPDYHVELARCLYMRGEMHAYAKHLDVAIRLWVSTGHIQRAITLIDELISAIPGSAITWNLKGTLHDLAQQTGLAEAAYRHAIDLDPMLLSGHTNIANICEASNRIDEAKHEAAAALRLAPLDNGSNRAAIAGAHLLTARLARREAEFSLALKHIDAVDSSPGTRQLEVMSLFERGKVLDLLDESDKAMECFSRANALAQVGPDVDDSHGNKFSLGVDYLLALVDRGWLQEWRLSPFKASPDTTSPVFLLGFPRSGTTLLNSVLFSHSKIQVLEEEETFAETLVMVRRMPGGYPQALARCDGIDAQLLRETYWRAVGTRCTPRPGAILVDKFPFYLTLAGAIHVVFPNAKFLFALRHPCDVVLSCFMQNFRLNDAMANFRTLADSASLYDRTMRLWCAFRETMALDVHTVRYETLVGDFDGETRRMCDFLGVPWEASLLRFSERALDRGRINTASYEQVSQPLYQKARYRWERYRKHLDPHLQILEPWIKQFDYLNP